jgi:hypothetical protein
MRGTTVDLDDCLMLTVAQRKEIDIDKLVDHFHELVSYDVAQDRLRPNIDHFLRLLEEGGFYD